MGLLGEVSGRAGVTAALGLLLALSAAPAYGVTEPKSARAPVQERVDSYGVTLRVRQDGGLHVTETIAYHFGTGSVRHGIVRTIPLRRHAGSGHDRVIEIRNARVQGAAAGDLHVTTSGDHTVLKVGNPDAAVSGVKTYVIDYDVPRALVPRGSTNELSWNAVGTEWTVPVRAVTVNVSAPVRIASATCRYGSTGATTACAGGPPAGSSVTFTQPGLGAGKGVTVEVALPKAGMNVTPPPYEARPAPFAFTALGGVLALVAAGIVALIALLFLPRRVRRLPASDATAPPAGVSSGLAGVLRGGGVAGSRHVAATVIDLAARGYLRFEETTSDRGRLEQRLVRGHRLPDDLAPYEAEVVEGLLGKSGHRRDSVAVSVTGKRRWAAKDAIYHLLETEACERGWFRRRPTVQRLRTALLATYLAAAAIALFVAAVTTAAASWVPTRGLGWAALAFLAASGVAWLARRRPARTAAGARALAEVSAYAEALRTWSERSQADAGVVSRVFPYAVAFGKTGGWGDVFEEFAGDLPWYVAAEGADDHETAKRIKRLAGMVAPRPSEPVPGASRRRRFGFLDSSRPFENAYARGGGAAVYGGSGGYYGDAGGGSVGGGSVGGGDGGGGGGGW
jgi:uncharacterized membrane protein YgcG